jgi:hypothetical protein
MTAMKNLLLLLLFLLPAAVFSAQSNPGLEAISQALSAGDAEALSKYFSGNVEISIQDNEQTFDKVKATEKMRSFFGSNKPKAFSQMHKGTSRENSDQYCIGNLSTANGNYRVYIYLKVTTSGTSIQELRLDKE